MKRLLILAATFACAVALGHAEPAAAAPFRPLLPSRRPVNPNRMPGWDWWRTYPWSPYNYGRNPYNPIIVPYPYGPYSYPYAPPYEDTAPDGTMFPSQMGQRIVIPHPTGEMKGTPPGAAIIVVRVPDAMAKVQFDGEPTYTVGTKRYFATPELQEGKTYSYAVTATWTENGQTVTGQREVRVAIGQTTVVDFRAKSEK